jgi:lysylphosphatidylglycerol synthetase-like protein (DUF2156 family)
MKDSTIERFPLGPCGFVTVAMELLFSCHGTWLRTHKRHNISMGVVAIGGLLSLTLGWQWVIIMVISMISMILRFTKWHHIMWNSHEFQISSLRHFQSTMNKSKNKNFFQIFAGARLNKKFEFEWNIYTIQNLLFLANVLLWSTYVPTFGDHMIPHDDRSVLCDLSHGNRGQNKKFACLLSIYL